MKTSILVASAVTAFLGCGREEESSRDLPPPPGRTDSVQAAQAKPELDAVLAAYEKVRALLAEDKTEGLADAAEALRKAAEEAAAKAPEAARKHLSGIASSAASFKQDGAKDVAKARRAFGEVSRHAVGLVSAEPSLAKGRHVFLCPMAKDTYGKWIQTNPDVSNPYMGKKMPG